MGPVHSPHFWVIVCATALVLVGDKTYRLPATWVQHIISNNGELNDVHCKRALFVLGVLGHCEISVE